MSLQRGILGLRDSRIESRHHDPEELDSETPSVSALAWLAADASDRKAVPADLAHQHDHYLYGTPERG